MQVTEICKDENLRIKTFHLEIATVIRMPTLHSFQMTRKQKRLIIIEKI